MKIIKKLNCLLLSVIFLSAVACSSGGNKATEEETVEDTATELMEEMDDMDSTSVEMDSTSMDDMDSTATI